MQVLAGLSYDANTWMALPNDAAVQDYINKAVTSLTQYLSASIGIQGFNLDYEAGMEQTWQTAWCSIIKQLKQVSTGCLFLYHKRSSEPAGV